MNSPPSKRAAFLSTYRQNQAWSLPDSIIFYMAKNPPTPWRYQKMIKSCKYFFLKNPLIVTHNISHEYEDNEWKTYINNEIFDLKKLSTKIWMSQYYIIDNSDNLKVQNCLSSILPKIYRNDIDHLRISFQSIALNDLVILASKCEKISLKWNMVYGEDGSVVAVEKLVEAFPNVKEFEYGLPTDGINASTIITSNSIKELLKIPHFLNLKCFSLLFLPETFDVDIFYSYMKTNKKTAFSLTFRPHISAEYRNRLRTIVIDILNAVKYDFKVPSIFYDRMDPFFYKPLKKLAQQHKYSVVQ